MKHQTQLQEHNNTKQINKLVNDILQVFVPVFISKEIDSLNPERYNSSNLKTEEDNT